VPVFGPDNTIAAALNAIVPRPEAAVPLIVPALLTAAHGISRALKAAAAPRRQPFACSAGSESWRTRTFTTDERKSYGVAGGAVGIVV
jgi:hypothetical protein